MNCVVIIKDHVTDDEHRHYISLAEYDGIVERWCDPDPVLSRLKVQPLFANCDCWDDLDREHYVVLLNLHIALAADLPAPARTDQHPVVRSLRTVLAALVFDLSIRTEGDVSHVTIHRISDKQIEIDFAASLHTMELPKPRVGLTVVVDNS